MGYPPTTVFDRYYDAIRTAREGNCNLTPEMRRSILEQELKAVGNCRSHLWLAIKRATSKVRDVGFSRRSSYIIFPQLYVSLLLHSTCFVLSLQHEHQAFKNTHHVQSTYTCIQRCGNVSSFYCCSGQYRAKDSRASPETIHPNTTSKHLAGLGSGRCIRSCPERCT